MPGPEGTPIIPTPEEGGVGHDNLTQPLDTDSTEFEAEDCVPEDPNLRSLASGFAFYQHRAEMLGPIGQSATHPNPSTYPHDDWTNGRS